MNNAIGLVELKSIPKGIETADIMLKAANVTLVMATPICPGKYIIVISGNIGTVKNAINKGAQTAGIFLVESHIITSVHDTVLPALMGLNSVEECKAIGIIETMTAITSIKVGDIAATSSSVELIEIRVARGLGGKGFVLISGEISSVRSAVNSVLHDSDILGEITSTSVISSPHKELLKVL